MGWNGKLGRHTLGFYRKDKVKYGNWTKIKSKFEGKCTLCHELYPEGMDMMYNSNRMPGCKMAHISCLLHALESGVKIKEGNE